MFYFNLLFGVIIHDYLWVQLHGDIMEIQHIWCVSAPTMNRGAVSYKVERGCSHCHSMCGVDLLIRLMRVLDVLQ